MHVWYFAYGSNMSRGTFLERRGMSPVETRRGWVDGYRLCFDIPVGPGERAVANLAVADAFRSHGVAHLLTIDDADRLDRTEGVAGGLYYREPVSIGMDAGAIDGFTYRSTLTSPGRKPSARYLDILLDGARTHALPDDWLRFLESFDLGRRRRR
jgi:hypothetical protein